MTARIEWKNPPERNRGPRKYDHAGIAEALRERPGEWGLVLRKAPVAYATVIRKGQNAAYGPAGAFEATVRDTKGTTRGDVYARFVGETVRRAA